MPNTCDSPTPLQRKASGAIGENVNAVANGLAVVVTNGVSVPQRRRARPGAACPVPQRVQASGREGIARNRPATFGSPRATPVKAWRIVTAAIVVVAPVWNRAMARWRGQTGLHAL